MARKLEQQQEIIMNISDIIMEVFRHGVESCCAAANWPRPVPEQMPPMPCAVYLRDAIARIELASRTVLSACAEGDELRRNLSRLANMRLTIR